MAWPTRAILAALALPVFTACALTLYYYHLKDREWQQYLQNIQKQEIEVPVPLNCVGSLIGRGGQKIKELQEKTQTKIKFKESTDDNEKFRVCRVFGTKENIEIARAMIFEIINPKDIETLEMYVPKFACGRIIGRCGDNIRAIMRKSNAQVHIASEDSRGYEVLITIRGKADEIASAKKLIDEKVQEAQKSQLPRSPRTRTKIPKENSAEFNKVPQCEKLVSTSGDGMIQVYVSSVATPHNFWVQLCSPRGVELDHLVDNMTDYYSRPENQKLHKLKEVKKGQIVASKFQHDGKWYRVEVFSFEYNAENPDESQVDIFYVDYGDSAFYKLSDLLELKPEYLDLKFQAIEVSLKGVLPKGEDWDEDAIETFTDMVYSAQWKALLAQVVSYKESVKATHREPIPIVRLYDPDGPPGMDIATQLIEGGYAVRDQNDEPDNKPASDDDDESADDYY